MTAENNFKIHKISLSFALSMGGGFFFAGAEGIPTLLAALAAAAAAVYVSGKIKIKNRIFKLFILKITGLFCIAQAVITLRQYIRFLKEAVFFELSTAAIGIITVIAVIFVFLSERKVIYKFSLIAFVVCGALLVALFLISFENAAAENLRYCVKFEKDGFLSLFALAFFPTVLLPFFEDEDCRKTALEGLAVSGAVYAAQALFVFTVFGSIAARVKYPFFYTVDSSSIGKIYTRLDGFFLMITYIFSVLKCGISVKIAKKAFSLN